MPAGSLYRMRLASRFIGCPLRARARPSVFRCHMQPLGPRLVIDLMTWPRRHSLHLVTPPRPSAVFPPVWPGTTPGRPPALDPHPVRFRFLASDSRDAANAMAGKVQPNSSPPRRPITSLARMLLDQLTAGPQCGVPRRMTPVVVELLKVIGIEQHEGERGPDDTCRHRVGASFPKCGQAITLGQVVPPEPADRADIEGTPYPAGAADCVATWRSASLYGRAYAPSYAFTIRHQAPHSCIWRAEGETEP